MTKEAIALLKEYLALHEKNKGVMPFALVQFTKKVQAFIKKAN